MLVERANVKHLHALYYVFELFIYQVQLLLVDILIEESCLMWLGIEVTEVANRVWTELPASFRVEVHARLPLGRAISTCSIMGLALLSCVLI